MQLGFSRLASINAKAKAKAKAKAECMIKYGDTLVVFVVMPLVKQRNYLIVHDNSQFTVYSLALMNLGLYYDIGFHR